MTDWDTPFGLSVRYTVRLHVIGEDRNEEGTIRGADRYVQYRVVTPHGELKAAALAASLFDRDEPRSAYREIEIIGTEDGCIRADEDARDFDSLGL